MKQIIRKNIADLKTHPIHDAIYSTRSIEGFKNWIKEVGQLVPITITTNDVIISGALRVRALKELGHDSVEAIVKEYASYEDEVLDLIQFNKARTKLLTEVVQEIIRYKEMYGKRQGQRSDLQGKSAYKGSSRDMIAEALDISSKSVDQILFIYETDPGLLMAIDKREETINSAHKTAKSIAASKNITVENSSTESIKENLKKSMDILFPDVCMKISEDRLEQIIGIIGDSDAKQCQCPHCSTILDFIDLIKNHKYADNNR